MSLILEALPQASDFDAWTVIAAGILIIGIVVFVRGAVREHRKREIEAMQENVFRRPPLE